MLRKAIFSVKIIAILFPLLLLGVLLTFPRPTVGYASDNSTLYVNIEQISEITVYPPSLSWSLPPCRASTPKLLDVRNTGSLNVSDIHAYVSTLDNETIRPYGQDNASWYTANSLITIRNETNASIYFAGRLEWNWTEDISYKDLTELGSGACTSAGHNCSWGFVRNTSYEYLWAISNGTDPSETGLCNFTDTQLALENDTDTGASDGSTRTPCKTGITNNGADASYSYFSINREGHLLEGSCVAISAACDKIYIYKYDMRSNSGTTDFDTCSNARYVQVGNLVPRAEHTLTLDAYAHYGIPDGTMGTGIIYIEAKA
jgi:hypothetical protein